MATTATPQRRLNPATGKPETREQCRERVLGDRSPVRIRGVARIVGLSEKRVRDLLRFRRDAEAVLADPDTDELARAGATKYLAIALPAPEPDPHGDQGIWWQACRIYDWARRVERLDEWYEPVPGGGPRPGRPADGPPAFSPRRSSFAEQLARLSRVQVSHEQAEALAGPLLDTYIAGKVAGKTAAAARDAAITAAAETVGVPAQVARKALLQIITAPAPADGAPRAWDLATAAERTAAA